MKCELVRHDQNAFGALTGGKFDQGIEVGKVSELCLRFYVAINGVVVGVDCNMTKEVNFAAGAQLDLV